LRSLRKIQPYFEEEAKAYAGLWSLGKNIRRNVSSFVKFGLFEEPLYL
jgi:hypothetical protein